MEYSAYQFRFIPLLKHGKKGFDYLEAFEEASSCWSCVDLVGDCKFMRDHILDVGGGLIEKCAKNVNGFYVKQPRGSMSDKPNSN